MCVGEGEKNEPELCVYGGENEISLFFPPLSGALLTLLSPELRAAAPIVETAPMLTASRKDTEDPRPLNAKVTACTL